MRKWMGLALLLFVCLLFLTCSKLSKKGTPPANKAPDVFLVNIPPDSTNFSTLAKIYWYGFDQDGYIARYQYLIIRDSGDYIPKLGGYIDSTFVKTIERTSSEDWNDSSLSVILEINRNALSSVDSTGNWGDVMLFASVDTAVYVSQYFFIRGVDNEGACSRIWKSGPGEVSNFRLFTRNNRPPVSKVTYSYRADVTGDFIDVLVTEYCLPETTVEWKGIKISWSAEDPDYSSRSQPSFSYRWKLLGPFSDSVTTIDTTKVYYYSWDNTTGVPWVDSTSRILVNLENAEGKDYGWYQFRVWARDDAFVPDPSPATATFKIIKPPFLFSENDKRSVLLVDATCYDGRVTLPTRDSIRAFYKRLIQELYEKDKISTDSSHFYRYDVTKVLPPKEEFASHYKLVILFNEGRIPAIQGYPITGNDTGFVVLERYLRVGGRVWMIGQNNFGVTDASVPTYIPIYPGSRTGGYTEATARVANYYFGVTGYFHPAFNPSYLGGIVSGRTEEMIAAAPYGNHTELPIIEVDSVRLQDTLDIWIRSSGPSNGAKIPYKGIPRTSWESIWNANYNERLYTFISYYPDTSKCHGRACASRSFSPNPWVFYENGEPHTLRWKTAEFSFPAFLMKESQMLEMMEVMVNWFMSDEVNP